MNVNRVTRALARTLPLFVLLAPLAPCVCAQAPSHEGKKSAGEATARVLLEGNLSNLAAFESFYCRYEIFEGTVDTVERAVSGKYRKALVAEVEWAVNEQNERWSFCSNEEEALLKELAERVKEEAKKAKEGKVSVGRGTGWPSAHYLSNGGEQMRYSPMLRFANLFDRDNLISQGDFLLPGADGVGPSKPNSAASLLKSLDQGRAAYGGTTTHDGRELHVIRSEYPERPVPGHCVSMIDPSRGFLIVRTVDESTAHHTTIVVAEAKQCDNRCWLPWRGVECMSSGQAGEVLAREYVVTELTLGPPSDDKFRVELPARTGVNKPGDHRTAFVIEAPMTVGLNDIAGLLDRAQKAASDFRAIHESANQSGTSTWWWVLGGGGLVVVCLIALLRRRWAHGAQRGEPKTHA